MFFAVLAVPSGFFSFVNFGFAAESDFLLEAELEFDPVEFDAAGFAVFAGLLVFKSVPTENEQPLIPMPNAAIVATVIIFRFMSFYSLK